MKIIEALKEIPLIVKKIEKNNQLIQTYSSGLGIGDNPTFAFGTEAQQRAEISSLLQSVQDLTIRRAKIKRALSVTNTSVRVTIMGMEKTITEWIDFRTYGLAQQIKALNSLNNIMGEQALANEGRKATTDNANLGVKIYRFYDEKLKNETISKLMELQSAIDSTLEIVNATTDMVVEI